MCAEWGVYFDGGRAVVNIEIEGGGEGCKLAMMCGRGVYHYLLYDLLYIYFITYSTENYLRIRDHLHGY